MIAPMAVVDDAEAWRRQVGGLARFYLLLAAGSPAIEVTEHGDLIAARTPGVPERSVLNAVVYSSTAALGGAYEEVAAGYDAIDAAWTVWVPDIDDVARGLLADNGHVLDADPEAMICDLAGIERPAEPEGFVRGASLDAVGALNDAAYDTGDEFQTAFAGHTGDGLLTYTAGPGPDAGLVFCDVDDDATVWLVATTPAARGKGYATALMLHGLADARERGRTTSTLQATDAGLPLYERIGYRSIGEIQMWEKRT